ncbi:uncharacterized protein LOC124635615 [Helicoverpa zea]|uniref:uncharacterized protein LOC124635615 n=1 Tax=Helicoverpa zea TaxID=7113 RepID=UPI001F56B9CF|nr:uncharacterized protein LOC124635615 [Helicoverpa zea]
MDYGQRKVAELKIELKKRGAKVTGTKEKLIERLNDYDRNNSFKSNKNDNSNLSSEINYVIEWPEEKLYKSVDSTTVLPNFDIININTYFLELYKDSIGMSDYSAVHRRGYNMLQNNYLLALVTANTSTHIFFKGQVHSENTKALTYFASIAICNGSGSIIQSVCECVAGKGPKAICKHVSVLCYAILKFREQNKWFIKMTPTQKKQVWHVPKKNKLDVSPKKAENLSYEIAEYNVCKKYKRSTCYDPRPQSSISQGKEWAATVRNKVINYCSLSQKRIGLCGILDSANMQDVIHDHDYLPFPLHHQLILNKISVSHLF